MTTIAIILVVFGSLIIATRGPLIVAPTQTRDLYMTIMTSDARMRGFGIAVGVIAAILAFLLRATPDLASLIVYYLTLLIVAMSALYLVPFPASANRLAKSIWFGFSPAMLRVIGIVSVAFGAWLISVGVNA